MCVYLFVFQNCVGDGQRLKEGNYEEQYCFYSVCTDFTCAQQLNKGATLGCSFTILELQLVPVVCFTGKQLQVML